MEWLGVVIGVIAAISGMALGWTARAREEKKELKQQTREDAGSAAKMQADMEYIKRGVDEIRIEQRATRQDLGDLCERVTRVEESAKQAHLRINEIKK